MKTLMRIFSRLAQGEDEHEEVDLLLPEYVNGTLGRKETKLVERHLARCAKCQNEVESVKQLQSAMLRLNEEIPAPAPGGLERALAQIRVAGGKEEPPPPILLIKPPFRAQERPTESPPPPPVTGIRGWIIQQPRWVRAGLAAAMVLILLQSVITFQKTTEPDGTFFADDPQPTATSPYPLLKIVFRENLTIDVMQKEVLDPFDGNIVSGPICSTGEERCFLVEVREPLQNNQQLDQIVKQVREDKRVADVSPVYPKEG